MNYTDGKETSILAFGSVQVSPIFKVWLGFFALVKNLGSVLKFATVSLANSAFHPFGVDK